MDKNRNNRVWLTVLGIVVIAGWSAVSGLSQARTSSNTVPISMIVSVEAKHGNSIPIIHREDVRVYQEKERVQVTDWVPLQGDHGAIQLYVLVDDSTDSTIGMQFDDLRHFIMAQPQTTSIAVGYIKFGMVDVVQQFTTDHAKAAKALRLPMGIGGGVGSPYTSIQSVIKNFPKSSAPREILLITNGIDIEQGGPNDPYVLSAVHQAQRAGIPIYAIYASSVGHLSHSLGRITWGQNNLSQLAEATGGEAYFQSLQTPIAFAPFLDEITDHLKHQYQLTFLAKTGSKANYQRVRLETEVPNAELVTAESVYVPETK